MRTTIPYNNVPYNYEKVIEEFISQIRNELGNALLLAYLTGSYARGDANDKSDLDIFCIFDNIDQHILEAVGYSTRNTSIGYETLEINAQCMSLHEYGSKYFASWSEFAVTKLNSVLLFGKELFHVDNLKDNLTISYKKSLADIIMSVRHYICVDEPKEKLTHYKISTYILKPLMFALRQERFCTIGIYPLSIKELWEAYPDENRILVEYFMDKEKFNCDIAKNHKEVLITIHNLIQKL